MGQRMNPTTSTNTNTSSYGRPSGLGASSAPSPSSSTPAINAAATSDAATPKPASVSNGAGTESVASLQGRSASPFNTGAPAGRAAIPSWQLAAAKNTSVANTTSAGSDAQEASGSA